MSEHKTINNHLQIASPEEKEIFLSTLCTLAQIDGKIKPEEMDFIESLGKTMHLELKPQFFTYSPKNCLSKIGCIKDRRLSLELIKDMLTIAYTDNDFSDSEGHFICDVGDALKIEPQKIGEISSWIIDHIIWLEQEALIFEETDRKGE